ncbi:olfactory receptor 7E178-like [Tenrec ecaudatus]|uniref:olfactory receptor 7E178-like n=1 Tax=Tenrec ecaudatus TaxID=94439 RepID=UPI003F5AD1B1
MEPQNLTGSSHIFLLGLSEDPELQQLLFELFLLMFMITVTGNLFIILLVSSDPYLHTPMYFFLSNLSLTDMGFISTTVPQMLVNIQTQNKAISYVGCLTQISFFFFYLFGCLDSLFLIVMAYDRFVAICHPLHYTVVMNPHHCGLLASASFLISLFDCQLHLLMVSQLTFCTDVEVPHFFCDALHSLPWPVPNLHPHRIHILQSCHCCGVPATGISVSYTQIVLSILRNSSSEGKYKVFSTCGSHLSVVCLFYGTGMGVYISSVVSSSARKGAVASVLYTVVTPMLNPFIYSLRNRDIKRALKRLLNRTA